MALAAAQRIFFWWKLRCKCWATKPKATCHTHSFIGEFAKSSKHEFATKEVQVVRVAKSNISSQFDHVSFRCVVVHEATQTNGAGMSIIFIDGF